MERIPTEIATKLLDELEKAQKQTPPQISYILYQIAGIISELSREYVDLGYVNEKIANIQDAISNIVIRRHKDRK